MNRITPYFNPPALADLFTKTNYCRARITKLKSVLGNFTQQVQPIGLILSPRAGNLCCEELLDGMKSCITVICS